MLVYSQSSNTHQAPLDYYLIIPFCNHTICNTVQTFICSSIRVKIFSNWVELARPSVFHRRMFQHTTPENQELDKTFGYICPLRSGPASGSSSGPIIQDSATTKMHCATAQSSSNYHTIPCISIPSLHDVRM